MVPVLQTTQAAAIDGLKVLKSTTDPQAAADFTFQFTPNNMYTLVFATLDLPICMSVKIVTANPLD